MSDSIDTKPVKAAWWKRLLLVGFSAGAGLGLVVAVIGFFVWRSSRPASLLPWNKSAIKTSMVNFDVLDFYPVPDAKHPNSFPTAEVSYEFDLQDTTDTDYMLAPPRNGVTAMQRLKSSGTLIDGSGVLWRTLKGTEDISGPETYIDKPILLPPGQAVRVVFLLDYQFSNNRSPTEDTLDQFGRDQSKDVGGFVLLDQVNHYQIDLPIDEAKVAATKRK